MKSVLFTAAFGAGLGERFVQTTCFNEECTLACKSHEFPLNQCLQAQGGLSAILACKADVVEQQTFCGSSCTGDVAETKEIPQDVCVKGNQPGDYFKDSCLSDFGGASTTVETITDASFAQMMFNHRAPAANGTWSQKVCSGTGCSDEDNCTIETYNQGQCYPVEGGGSAVGECWTCGVRLSVWSADGCPGAPSQIMNEPVGECAKQQGGSWAMNFCNSSSLMVAESVVKMRPPTMTTTTTTTTTRVSLAHVDFSQLVCKDRECSTDCGTESYTFNDCLPVVGGGSARGVTCCDNTDCVLQGFDFGLLLDVYHNDDCTGSSQRMKEPVKECDRTSSGDEKFAKFVCGGNSSLAAPTVIGFHLHSAVSV
jgi:hypothetical protein